MSRYVLTDVQCERLSVLLSVVRGSESGSKARRDAKLALGQYLAKLPYGGISSAAEYLGLSATGLHRTYVGFYRRTL